MPEVNLIDFFAPLLALSLLIERLNEVTFEVIEFLGGKFGILNPEGEGYVSLKRILTLALGILFGLVVTNVLQLNVFPSVGNPSQGQVVSGFVAGAMSPYAHQFLELLTKGQKKIEKTTPQTPPTS